LRGRIERSERFHVVAEEVDPHRHLRVERVDVQNPAAQGELAGLFAERLMVVAEVLGEPARELAQLQSVPFAHDQLGARGGLGRGRRAHEGRRRAGDQQGAGRVMPAVTERRQCPE